MRNILIWCTMFIPLLLSAQETKRDKQLFVAYIAGGMNMSQIGGDLMAGYRKVGGNIGVGTHIMYIPQFSNSIEISYSMKGSQEAFKKNDPLSFRKYSFDYVEIPVLFNYHEKEIAIFYAGFTFGRLIRFDTYHAGGLVNGDPKKWEFGATVGATFLIKKRFGIDLKANFGLNSVIKGNDPNSRARRGGWYHNTLSLRFSYLFKKKSDSRE